MTTLTSADMAFHMWIYEAAGNPLLVEMLRMYWHHLRRAMIAVIEPLDGRDRVWQEHEEIIKAVLSGNERQAELLSQQHIQGATQRVIQHLPE